METIRTLVVDDHPLFADGLKAMFKPTDGIEVVDYITNGNQLPTLLKTLKVDLILMDMDMPILDGIASMELINKYKFDIPILVLTMHQSMKKIKTALEKGAQGYILKDASKAELVEAIKKTSQRENYFHPKINNQVFDYLRGKKIAQNAPNELSEREHEIIECLSKGQNTKAIAQTLHISEHTVKTHRRNIMYKLNVKTSAELIKLAIEKGIIDL